MFKEGSKFPTTYAFALVEHSQANLLRLRMYFAREVIQINKDAVKSQRLLNMCSLITSSISAVEKCLFSLKEGLSRKAFVLIQGPPRTGKTQTILGLLSAILHATPTRVHSKGVLSEIKRGPELPMREKNMAVDKDKPQDEASILHFCKIVLGWDYFRLVKESKKNDQDSKKVGGDKLGLREVKDTYKDVDDYLATFEPLLFEEVKAQIIQ